MFSVDSSPLFLWMHLSNKLLFMYSVFLFIHSNTSSISRLAPAYLTDVPNYEDVDEIVMNGWLWSATKWAWLLSSLFAHSFQRKQQVKYPLKNLPSVFMAYKFRFSCVVFKTPPENSVNTNKPTVRCLRAAETGESAVSLQLYPLFSTPLQLPVQRL